ncbi:MAG: diacylglycerol kinase family protein [Verrucomicrobiales bacterium]
MYTSPNRFRLIKSFLHAGRGLRSVFVTEGNFRIHLAALVCVVVLGFAFRLSGLEWAAVLLAAAGVLTAETLNTAVEYLADALRPERDPKIGRAKDAASGAVLVAAVAAVVVGAIVFCPKLWQLISTLATP